MVTCLSEITEKWSWKLLQSLCNLYRPC